MSTFGSNLELHEKIGDSLNRLSKSELSVQELEDLLACSREFYERILVLRYKAFEKQVHGDTVIPASIQEDEVLPAKEEVIVPDEPPAIEFALFGEISDEVPIKMEEPLSIKEPIANSAEIIVDKPAVFESPKIENTVSPSVEESKPQVIPQQAPTGSSLLDKLASNNTSNRLGDQLKKSHIESILSVLTLNDKIRFTKNLFDGNSDTFNAAIQLLDAQKSLTEAKDLLNQYSSRYEWNSEDKNTLDFYEFVERRYA